MAHLRHVLAAAAPLAVAGTIAAQAQERGDRLFQTARAAVRAELIEPFCGPFYTVDRRKVGAVRGEIIRDAVERFGADVFTRAVQDVRPEFAAEMQAGAAVWCPKQREAYRKLGLPGLIGGNQR